jgi:hypothetical protein
VITEFKQQRIRATSADATVGVIVRLKESRVDDGERGVHLPDVQGGQVARHIIDPPQGSDFISVVEDTQKLMVSVDGESCRVVVGGQGV